MKKNSQIIAAEIPEVNREKTAKFYPVFALLQMTNPNPNCIKAWIIQPLYAINLLESLDDVLLHFFCMDKYSVGKITII